MVRLHVFALDEILPFVSLTAQPQTYAGVTYKLTSHRLLTFKVNHRCVVCGRVGLFFSLEQDYTNFLHQPTKAHLNMYAVDPDGTWVLMTKDHIIPKVHGGTNTLENYQTMCLPCNNRKGSRLDFDARFVQRRSEV